MAKIIFANAEYNEKITLSAEALNYLKKNKIKSLALFSSIQFSALDNVKKQLENLNINVIISKARRAEKQSQLLGCNVYPESFKSDIFQQSDAILYIGDGLFHPKALLLAQIYNEESKQVIAFNPLSKEMKTLAIKDIESIKSKLKANLKRFLSAETIGILVSIKPGQYFLNQALALKEKLHKENKKAYIFIADNISLQETENFPFVQAWVNTACPRIGLDDALNINKPIINIREALNPVKYLEMLY